MALQERKAQEWTATDESARLADRETKKKVKRGHMEVTHCKKCGRLLRDPESIARGMGPECAGIAGDRQKRYHCRRRIQRSSICLQGTGETTSPTLFSLVREEKPGEDVPLVGEEDVSGRKRSDHFGRFPSDLVDLVLSVSAPGTIASRIPMYSRQTGRKLERINRGNVLKEIRRMCIQIRLTFWPGIVDNGQPVACVPYGEDGWKFENSERILSSTELEAYLTRYGMISTVR